jgi:hypothetical protein
MVKFGRHLQFYLESDEPNGPGDEPYVGKLVHAVGIVTISPVSFLIRLRHYLVPYNDIKEFIGKSQHHFTREWMASLKQANED